MIVSSFKATPVSLAICEALAERTGIPYDAEHTEQASGELITRYFADIQIALAPEFDGIVVADFTRRRITAYASRYGKDRKPFIHIDQQFELWLHSLLHLWSVRAFFQLNDKSRQGLATLFTLALDVESAPLSHEELREDMLHVFAKFGEAWRFAHLFTISGMVFVICHELAHHTLEHLEESPSAAQEFEADRLGFELMRRVHAYAGELRTVVRPSYAMAAPWMVLQLLDLAERRRAQRLGRTARAEETLHPLASERVDRLLPMIEADRNADVMHFLNGYGEALSEISRDTGLDTID